MPPSAAAPRASPGGWGLLGAGRGPARRRMPRARAIPPLWRQGRWLAVLNVSRNVMSCAGQRMQRLQKPRRLCFADRRPRPCRSRRLCARGVLGTTRTTSNPHAQQKSSRAGIVRSCGTVQGTQQVPNVARRGSDSRLAGRVRGIAATSHCRRDDNRHRVRSRHSSPVEGPPSSRTLGIRGAVRARGQQSMVDRKSHDENGGSALKVPRREASAAG